MPRYLRAGWLGPLLALLLLSAPASARDFKTHFDLAIALYNAQRYEDSIPEFKAAYEAEAKPALLFNIAQAYRKSGHPREAIQYYDQYLASDPKLDDDTRRKVDSYLAEARNTLAALELELKQRLAEQKAERDKAIEPAPATVAPAPAAPAPVGVAAAPPPPPPQRPIYKRWWFWTAIGGVVAAGVVVGASVGATQAARPDLSALSGVPRTAVTF